MAAAGSSVPWRWHCYSTAHACIGACMIGSHGTRVRDKLCFRAEVKALGSGQRPA